MPLWGEVGTGKENWGGGLFFFLKIWSLGFEKLLGVVGGKDITLSVQNHALIWNCHRLGLCKA